MGVNGTGDKDEMIRLNDKLAAYMQKVRKLGSGSDTVVFLDTLRSIEDEVKKLKGMYDRELDKYRQNLEQANRQKIDAETELEKSKRKSSDLDDWYRVEKDKNGRLLCENNELKEKIADLEKQLALAKSSVQGPQQQLQSLEAELFKEKTKSCDLGKSLDNEKAKIRKLQDKIKDLESQVDFNEQMKNESNRDAGNRLDQAKKIINELEIRNRELQRQNDGLPVLLEQMRKKTDQDLQVYKKDVENSNKKNMESLKVQLADQAGTIEQLRADKVKLESENQDLMNKVRNLESQVKELTNQIANLEIQIDQERSRGLEQIKILERKLKELQDELLSKMDEVNAGKDVQVSLKSEIEAYRLLLDEEEKRLGTPMVRSKSQSSCVKPSSGSVRGSGMDRNRLKTPNKSSANLRPKYENRTEYQYAYSRWGRPVLPKIDNTHNGGFTTSRPVASPCVRGNGSLAKSYDGNIRAYSRN
ncbi:Intermediate filament tail domain-containing protein [Mactra antiquata]